MPMPLTSKQDTFAVLIAEGITSIAAYRKAYDASAMKPGSIWTEASRLCAHPQVAQRVEELRQEKEEERRLLRLSHAEAVLMRLEHEAMTAKTDSTRVKALELIGRHLGMFVDRVEVTTEERSAETIEHDIKARLQRLGFVEEA